MYNLCRDASFLSQPILNSDHTHRNNAMNTYTHYASRSRHTAFTLIELLVVISIVSILISILLPTLSAAIREAETLRCKANLKQLGLTLAIYMDDNKEIIPPRHGHNWHDGSHPRPRWSHSYVSLLVVDGYLPERTGFIMPGEQGTDIGWCPTYLKSPAAWTLPNTYINLGRTSYGINGFVDGEWLNQPQIHDAKTVFLGDARTETLADWSFDTLAAIHDEKANLLFFDQHVSIEYFLDIPPVIDIDDNRRFWGKEIGEGASNNDVLPWDL